MENSRNALVRIRDAGVERPRDIQMTAAGRAWTGERTLEGGRLRRRQAACATIRAPTNECFRVELARARIEDEAVEEAVIRVAGIAHAVDDGLLLGAGQCLPGHRLTIRAARRHLVQLHVDPVEAKDGVVDTHIRGACDYAVEFRRVALRREHRLAAAR